MCSNLTFHFALRSFSVRCFSDLCRRQPPPTIIRGTSPVAGQQRREEQRGGNGGLLVSGGKWFETSSGARRRRRRGGEVERFTSALGEKVLRSFGFRNRGVIFYMIPPSKTGDEVDQSWMRGGNAAGRRRRPPGLLKLRKT